MPCGAGPAAHPPSGRTARARAEQAEPSAPRWARVIDQRRRSVREPRGARAKTGVVARAGAARRAMRRGLRWARARAREAPHWAGAARWAAVAEQRSQARSPVVAARAVARAVPAVG